MSKLKGVVVGAGYFSQFHLEAWQRLPQVDLAAICDLNSQAAQQSAQEFGIPKSYDDFEQMLDQEAPDFVDIITRPDSHLSLTRQAVDRRVSVICQKPLAPSFEEARQLVELASRAGVRLMVHENFRFQPWYREMKRLLTVGTIGDRLHSIGFCCRTGDGWQPDAYLGRQPYFREMERFLIFETGVHFIDTFRYLGGEITGVYATLRKLNPGIAGEDAGTLLFEFENDARGIWDGNRFNESRAEDPRYTFGEMLVEASGGSIRLHHDGQLTIQPLGQPDRVHEYVHERKNFAGDCVFRTQQHFVECLLADEPFETSGNSYLKTLSIQEAVYESAATGLPVRDLQP